MITDSMVFVKTSLRTYIKVRFVADKTHFFKLLVRDILYIGEGKFFFNSLLAYLGCFDTRWLPFASSPPYFNIRTEHFCGKIYISKKQNKKTIKILNLSLV